MKYIKLLKNLYQIKKNIKKTPEQIQKLQKKKLQSLLSYAYKHSPYYHKTFEDAGITADNISHMPLSSFPATDKTQFFRHFDELVTVSDLTQKELRQFDTEESIDRKTFKGKYHIVHSSGSTGRPTYFVYDEQAWQSMLLGIIRGALWELSMPQILKLLVRGPHIVYIAATDGRYGGAMAVGDGIDGVGAKQIYLDIKTPLGEWIRQIQEFQPNIVIGYPSAIKILAELLENKEIEMEVFRVISCGEPLGSSLRKYLETVFHTPIVNIYGASESLSLGVETSPKEGMYLFDDMNIIEIVDGNMYLTCLYNFAQPLIRYRLSDSLTLEAPSPDNRYPFTKAVGLLGRNEDLLWFEDSMGNREFLHPLAIEGFCIEGLLDYQFRQLSKNSFEMLAEISEGASEFLIRKEMLIQMKKILNEKGLKYVKFLINFVDNIPPNPKTGKKQLILQNFSKEREAV